MDMNVEKEKEKLTGQDSSVGVPRASKILVSWSRSESPARNGSCSQGDTQSCRDYLRMWDA